MAPETLKRHPTALPLSEEQQTTLQANIEREIEWLSRTLCGTPAPEFQRDGDEMDLTALRQGHELAHSVRARCGTQMAEWLRALRLLRNDPTEYVICEVCGRGIPWSRLEVLPTTRCCGRC